MSEESTTPASASAAASFVAAQQQFAPALKTNTNPAFRSKYVALDGCIEAVIDALNSNGFALIQKTIEGQSGGVTVNTQFLHVSGEVIDGGTLWVPAAKQDPQGFGSALTYARRYGLMAACGIAPEDDDGNAATKAVNQTQTKAVTPSTKPAAQASTGATQTSAGTSGVPNTGNMNHDQLRNELIRLTTAAKGTPKEESVSSIMQTAIQAGGVKKASDLPTDQFRVLVQSVQQVVQPASQQAA